jgi:DNA invertase Pin-like site-specific DNA recombinase
MEANVVIGYVRCSTVQQAESGDGLAAQRTAIAAEAARQNWEIHWIEDPAVSGGNAKRPGLERARQMLAAGDASAMVVSKLDRISRSMVDFVNLTVEAKRQGWQLISLDLPLDPSSATGEAMSNMMMTFAQLERQLIKQRIKDALAEKRAAGIRLGRPLALDPTIREWIAAERETRTLQSIADELNAEAVPTAHGGRRWHPSTVRAVLAAA